jgi:hypothetical protein
MPRLNRIFTRGLRFCHAFRKSPSSRKLSKRRRPKMVPLIYADSNQIHPSCVAHFMFSAIETLKSERKGRIDPERVRVGDFGEGDLGLIDRPPNSSDFPIHPRLRPLHHEEIESNTSLQWNYSKLEFVLNGYIQRSRICLRRSLKLWQRQTAYEKLFWLICLIEFASCLRQIQRCYNGPSNKKSNDFSTERTKGSFNKYNDYNDGLEALCSLRDNWLTSN